MKSLIVLSCPGLSCQLASERRGCLDRFENFQMIRQILLFQRQRKWRIQARHPFDRRLQGQEAALLNGGGDLSGKTTGTRRRMDNHQTACLEHRLNDTLFVPGPYAAQVDALAVDSLLLGPVHGALDAVPLRPAAQLRSITALFEHFGLPNRQLIILLAHLAYSGAVETLGLKEDHRVMVTNRRQ